MNYLRLCLVILSFSTIVRAESFYGVVRVRPHSGTPGEWLLEDDREKKFVGTICPRPNVCADIYRGSVWYFAKAASPSIANALNAVYDGARARVEVTDLNCYGTFYGDKKCHGIAVSVR